MIIHVKTERPVTLRTYLRGVCGISARLLTRLKQIPGGITRNGVQIRSVDLVCDGDEIILQLPNDTHLAANPSLCVRIAYESEQVVVYDKPQGMPVHPSVHHHTDTLGNAFAARYPELTFRPVNRLDSDTSGLCLIAKTAFSAHALSGSVEKAYRALVCGELTGDGTVDAPIARAAESIITRCVRADGKAAVTHYHTEQFDGKYSHLSLALETGRTHQIRVHMAHIGHPLAGDRLYGGDCTDYQRHMLHCAELSFTEPETGERIRLVSVPWWSEGKNREVTNENIN